MSEPDLLANHLGALWSTIGAALAPLGDGQSDSTVAILLTLRHWGPMPTTELAQVVGLSQPACTRALDKLVADGAVARTPAERNEVRLALTASGRRRAATLQDRRREILAGLLATLPAKDRADLARILPRLLGAQVTGRGQARRLCRFCDHRVCDGPACPIGCAATKIDGVSMRAPS